MSFSGQARKYAAKQERQAARSGARDGGKGDDDGARFKVTFRLQSSEAETRGGSTVSGNITHASGGRVHTAGGSTISGPIRKLHPVAGPGGRQVVYVTGGAALRTTRAAIRSAKGQVLRTEKLWRLW